VNILENASTAPCKPFKKPTYYIQNLPKLSVGIQILDLVEPFFKLHITILCTESIIF
jgi:hypothetical protein